MTCDQTQQALGAQADEEPFADEANLVLDLTLLPARCRRAGALFKGTCQRSIYDNMKTAVAADRINQVVAAHLQEAAIVEPILADEDRQLAPA